MKIKTLRIRNYKTFDEEGIFLTLTALATFVGENSTGKSNILEALELFFNFSSGKVSKQSFHHDDNKKDICIEIKFGELSDSEKKKFKIHMDEKEELEIKQIIKLIAAEEEENEGQEKYEESKHGTKWQSSLAWANLTSKPPGKRDLKGWWKGDLKIGGFDFKSLFDDPGNEPEPETYQRKLEQLWEEQFEIIPKEKITGDEKVLGWKNKLKGNLPKYFYVPAVKDVNEDLKVLKANPFGEIIRWLTQNITADRMRQSTDLCLNPRSRQGQCFPRVWKSG